MKFLIIRFSSIGDIVLTTPVVRCLKKQVVTAEVPLATMFGYVTDLRSMTQGRATSSLHFSHYAPVPPAVQEEVVAKVKGM